MSYSLDLSDLQKYQISREHLKYDYYQTVLSKCNHKIKVSASNFETQCFIPIPEFILGIPKYSQKECIQYVMHKLIKDGLKVLFINPNIIYINWDIQYAKPKLEVKPHVLIKKEPIQKIDYKPTSEILTNVKSSIYDTQLFDLLKHKTNQIQK